MLPILKKSTEYDVPSVYRYVSKRLIERMPCEHRSSFFPLSTSVGQGQGDSKLNLKTVHIQTHVLFSIIDYVIYLSRSKKLIISLVDYCFQIIIT